MKPTPNLTRPSEVRSLLEQLDFHPSRVLGQNFLIDRNILNILLAAADLSPQDHVVEVGPGLGVLTAALLERVAHLTAVEKDNRLAPFVRGRFTDAPNFTLIHADILDCALDGLFPNPGMKLVANLPYAIAARLLVELAGLSRRPSVMVVTLQREVADRLSAATGTKDYGLLSILLQRHYAISTLKHITRTCFWPPPEVQSSISKLVLRPEPLGAAVDESALKSLLRHAFCRRRKTMARSLRDWTEDPLPALAAAGIAPTERAEQIPPAKWPLLLRALPPPPVPPRKD
ncbi:MAG: 16S rRNA (adenine(1518)-N(6)/adenine(1519)-N(6))-dimethyltransferase RsmA [Verrucomicrobiota bacterium]|jgi:16S rRNA (adenine1518-N6/adenine1519-N6)-dimethyltransferase|nr:16S rRNA (adenine(1518)-N(6)/adenine(1519)-N(6))-dimethyltransferase RsmA [Verrucomicrobiota bacterium]